jgi:hypothetical protein
LGDFSFQDFNIQDFNLSGFWSFEIIPDTAFCIIFDCKYCVHMYINGKMLSIETIPGMGGGVHSSMI